MNHRFIITGAPGSGKTAILNELARQGYSIVCEPARQILRQQRHIGGEGTYDKNVFLFKELILSRAILAYEQHENAIAPVFYDRGLPDVLAYSDCFHLDRTYAKPYKLRNRSSDKERMDHCLVG